jgi:hypothetical protein
MIKIVQEIETGRILYLVTLQYKLSNCYSFVIKARKSNLFDVMTNLCQFGLLIRLSKMNIYTVF